MLRTLTFLVAAFAPFATAQDPAPPSGVEEPQKATQQATQQASRELPPLPAVLRFPENKDAVLATLDGHSVRLVELGRFLAQRYDPHILDRWALPEGRRELNSPWLAELLWQYLDVLALRKEAEAKKLPMSELQAAVDAELERDFEENYVKRYEKARGRKIDEGARDWYVADHRRKSGLRTEVQCLLNGLVPRNQTVSELRVFHTAHGDYFGGKVLVAHIHFATRDRNTGRRLGAEELSRVRNRMRDVQRMLDDDPSRFEELAREFSEDQETGPKGGEIGWITRFDDRLPAAVVRTAWRLDQGDISAPVESYYGYHLIRRLRFVQNHFLLPRQESFHKIAGAVQKVQQEDYLFEVRERHERRVRY